MPRVDFSDVDADFAAAFDEHGVLRDGHVARVPMIMRDSLQRAISEDAKARGQNASVRDFGKPASGVFEP